jgi:hypothetical protein
MLGIGVFTLVIWAWAFLQRDTMTRSLEVEQEKAAGSRQS